MQMGNRLTYSWAQVLGTAVCRPVVCGVPPDTARTRHATTSIVFPERTTYTSQLGYVFRDGNGVETNRSEVQCTHTGAFLTTAEPRAAPPGAVPVICGPCPSSAPRYANMTSAESGERAYSQACTYTCDLGFSLDQQAGGPTTFAIQCMATRQFEEPQVCSPVLCGPPESVPRSRLLAPASASEPMVYPEVSEYRCDTGYTLDGNAAGQRDFTITCQSSGAFTTEPECLPVRCGVPPLVNFSVYDNNPRVFNESVMYTCHQGYTLSAVSGEPAVQVLTCGADGQFAPAERPCLPVECGTPPSYEHAALSVAAPPVVHFAHQPLGYRCLPGYSLEVADDPFAPIANTFTVGCRYTGQFQVPPVCVNINDCFVRNCGDNGNCFDLPEATGVPLNDYTCECQAGYEISLVNSTSHDGELTKFCTNINDCPVPVSCGGRNDAGLRRGQCVDQVLGYACTCGAGYLVAPGPVIATNAANESCAPVVCGHPRRVVFAWQNATETPVTYDTPVFHYTCWEGYTLSGQAGGEAAFAVRCGYAANFEGI